MLKASSFFHPYPKVYRLNLVCVCVFFCRLVFKKARTSRTTGSHNSTPRTPFPTCHVTRGPRGDKSNTPGAQRIAPVGILGTTERRRIPTWGTLSICVVARGVPWREFFMHGGRVNPIWGTLRNFFYIFFVRPRWICFERNECFDISFACHRKNGH